MEEAATTNPQRPSVSTAELAEPQIRIGRSKIFFRILDFIIAGIFIYAAVLKIIEPVQFARDIDNYKILPWTAAVGLAFFLPWLEAFCGLALIFRRLYRGGLLILTALTTVFVVATIVAKARGLDISCGCFGHVSQGWSFGWHMALDVGLLVALTTMLFSATSRR